jgi:hypothetical protein
LLALRQAISEGSGLDRGSFHISPLPESERSERYF